MDAVAAVPAIAIFTVTFVFIAADKIHRVVVALTAAGLVASLGLVFALGADLGGDGTAVAASANVVMLGIAARAGQPISFWQFTKYGIVTTVVAWGYVWLRYLT